MRARCPDRTGPNGGAGSAHRPYHRSRRSIAPGKAVRRRSLGLPSRSRCDDPRRVYSTRAFHRRHRRRPRSPAGGLHPRSPGERRRLAAVPRRRRRRQCVGEGLFRSQMRRRRPASASYAAGAGNNPRTGRRGAVQCVRPHHARAVRTTPMAGGADHAARNHAAPGVVPDPPRQGVLLVAHCDCASPGASRPKAEGSQPQKRGHCGAVRRRPVEAMPSPGETDRGPARHSLSRGRPRAATARPVQPAHAAAARTGQGARLYRGATQRRSRARGPYSRRWPMRSWRFARWVTGKTIRDTSMP